MEIIVELIHQLQQIVAIRIVQEEIVKMKIPLLQTAQGMVKVEVEVIRVGAVVVVQEEV